MRKFSSKRQQLEWADRLLQRLADANTGGVTPVIKKMINDKYIKRIKK
jgi:citrate lyase beta subunit